MRKLKILHTVEFYAPHVGGAQLVVQRISEYLAARGHDVTVATTKLKDRNFSELNGVKIREFNLEGNLAHGFDGDDMDNYRQFVESFGADVMMNYAAQQWATDLALSCVLKRAAAKVNILCPCGYSALKDLDNLAHPEYEKYYKRYLPATLQAYDAVVYHSARYKDYEFGQRLGLKNSVVIPNAVEVEEFEKPTTIDFRRKYGIDTKYMLLSVGSFAVYKGQENLVQALIKMWRNDSTLVLIGSNHGTLQQIVSQSFGMPVKFLVDVPRADTVAAFKSADLFMFGSEVEAFPLVILESMASKLPYVSTECGNIAELSGGLVCSLDDLATASSALLEDPHRRKELGRQGHKEVTEKYTWNIILKQYEDLYYTLLSASDQPPPINPTTAKVEISGHEKEEQIMQNVNEPAIKKTALVSKPIFVEPARDTDIKEVLDTEEQRKLSKLLPFSESLFQKVKEMLTNKDNSVFEFLRQTFGAAIADDLDSGRVVLLHFYGILGAEKLAFAGKCLTAFSNRGIWEPILKHISNYYASRIPNLGQAPISYSEMTNELKLSGLLSGWQAIWLFTLQSSSTAKFSEEQLKDCYLHQSHAKKVLETFFPQTVQANGQAITQPAQDLAYETDLVADLRARDLWAEGYPLRLHLGCGEKKFAGYVNIDYPPSEHNVMTIRPDYLADITRLQCPPSSIDEIRLHHVFEHFSRVKALSLLIRWHQWLKIGGVLHIATPDLMGSARNLVANSSWKTKMGTVRHLSGDQAASWAYHLDHWFPERFEHTLKHLGFERVETSSDNWPQEPYLANVEAVAYKTVNLSEQELIARAESILRESMVADQEEDTFQVWKRQLKEALNWEHTETAPTTPSSAAPTIVGLFENLEKSNLPLIEIKDFNQRSRDRWVEEKAATLKPNSTVLDVGAGTCPYKKSFSHCQYTTHDFKAYTGEKLGGTTEYGGIDIESDIVSIPVPDNSFDAILCTEVLEHVPEPIAALREMARILKPGGRIFITAPLGSGLHQLPFHYYGGYTPGWYEKFFAEFGLDPIEIIPNGGFHRLLAQECMRFAREIPDCCNLPEEQRDALMGFMQETLPRFLFAVEEKSFNDQFTVGYHVEGLKRP